MTIKQAINDLMDASRSIAEVAESESDEANRINAQNVADDCKQLAAWLRELQERRKAPEIIYCHECVKHNQSYGDNGTIDSCPLVLYRGKAQGHEFDYQYCAFAERRTE